jgi:hypothetical protein
MREGMLSPEDEETEPENAMQSRLNAAEQEDHIVPLFKSGGER